MDWAQITALLGALVALSGVVLGWHRWHPERRKLDAEARELAARTEEAKLRADETLWERINSVQAQALQQGAEIVGLKQSLRLVEEAERLCNARLKLLESVMPLAAFMERLEDLPKTARVLDHLADAFAITHSAAGGSFRFVNKAFAQMLGMTTEQIILTGWQALCHPDDVRLTQRAESQAWDASVDGFVNRFRTADGGWRRIKWWSSPYDTRGYSISVALDCGEVTNNSRTEDGSP